jgi:hypothetical protein
MGAGWFEVEKYRDVTPELIEGFEVDFDTCSARYRYQVDQAVGGTPIACNTIMALRTEAW